MKEVIIIGNGIAGITAARHIRKRSDYSIKVISAESRFFWSRTALMYIYMGHMKFKHTKPYEDAFWVKNRIDLVHDKVTGINTAEQSVMLESGNVMSYDYLILATGSKPNKFGWPGEDAEGVTGMVSKQDLERIETYTKGISRGVIVGGGLIGIELAEMLRSRKIEVTFLVRESYFWQPVLPEPEGLMISQHIRDHGVDLRLSTELKEIIPDENGRVKAIRTNTGEEIVCQFVGLTAGVHANLDLALRTDIKTNRGYLVNTHLQTSVPNIYAIGDCAEVENSIPGRKNIEQVWYVGRMMGEVAARNITGTPTDYQPGPWFNSAKFFDIEYQTYGNVNVELPEDQLDFFWKAPGRNVAIHLRFRKDNLGFIGINAFGIRYRHKTFDQWLRMDTSIDTVLNNLHKANFDPEFFRDYTKDIRQAFQAEFPEIPINSRKKVLGLF